MIYTKEEFNKLWESDENGGGLTCDDCADCAEAWGLCSHPRCARLTTVVYDVCMAAGIKEEEIPLL